MANTPQLPNTPHVPFEFTADFALVLGKRTPGLTVIERGGLKRGWDQRKGYGYSGAFSVYTGDDLITFDLIFRMYTKEDWALYRVAILPIIMTAPRTEFERLRGGGKAIDIVHPILEDLGVRSFVVTQVHQLKQTDPGVWEKTIECLQFRKPKIALAKPEGSAQKPNEPEDPYDKFILLQNAENQALRDEVNGLAQ